MTTVTHRLSPGRFAIGLIAAACWLVGLNAGPSFAATSPSYPHVAFSDGFDGGSLSAWDGTAGSPGTVSVTGAAAHSGSFGARLTNAAGQYALIVKTLPQPLVDSSVGFWARVGSGGGIQTLAQARDQSSSQTSWSLLYDGIHQGLYFYPYNGAGASTEIFTGANTVPTNTWVKIEVQYTATSTGGAQLYVNGQTRDAWGVSGDYTRTANLQRVQLWNDSAATTDFDDVTVATPPLSAPSAPTGVQGTGHDSSVALHWTAPASDGGSPITGYQVTIYLNGTAQAPILTNSPSADYSVDGLGNGTVYTFSVAAINAVGTGSDSTPSAPVTPVAATVPGTPTAVQAVPFDGSATVSWTSPSSDGDSPITGYQITPFRNGTAQKPVKTTTSLTSQHIDGLTNGAAYTFTVAAANAVGAGPTSGASAPVTPTAAPTRYPHAVFSDGFESGSLSAWDGTAGSPGTVSVTGAAAHRGSVGARLTNAAGQYALIVKTLPQPLVDSSVRFWARVGSGGGIQTLAQARDQSSSQVPWSLLYDGTRQGLYLDAYNGAGASTEIFTGANTVPTNTWVKIEVQYTATSTGGAQLYVNGQTSAAWGVSGDYTRTANLQRVQLWNDSAATTDFDDVTISSPAPGPSTGVRGTKLDSAVALVWTAPASDGGSPITGYQITIHSPGPAQAPILTNSTATGYTMTGLQNGTAYTFTVAAINALATGPDSTPSAPVTPTAATVPGTPTAVQATPGDSSATVSWTAPASDGGSPITGYQITPFMNGTAQTPVLTNTSLTSQQVVGLTNGVPYTFKVAAINAVGAGADSGASAAVTPVPAPTH